MEQQLGNRDWRLCYARLPSRFSESRSAATADYPDLDARERAAGVRPGQPFLLRPDARPDLDVLLYLTSPSFQCLAADTQTSYALDLKVFLSFLSAQDKDWRSATGDDLADFEFWRRRDNRNSNRIGPSKFTRELAAINKFYRWQCEPGTVTKSPVEMTERKLRSGDIAVGPALRPKSTRSYRVKWLTPRLIDGGVMSESVVTHRMAPATRVGADETTAAISPWPTPCGPAACVSEKAAPSA